MDHWKVIGFCLCASIAAGGVAHADDSGFYAGASIGQARQKARGFEGNDLSYKLFGGWSFNKYLAVEGGYVDGGSQTDDWARSCRSLQRASTSPPRQVAGRGRFVPYVKLGYLL